MTVLREIAGIISDLDGVTYRGDAPIESAVRAFRKWHDVGLPYAFVTNNSTKTAEEFSEKLNGMGIPTEPFQVVTSANVAADYARQRLFPEGRVFVIGSTALKNAVMQQGLVIAEDHVDAVVVGLDRSFTFQTLKKAQAALLNGALFIGTNPDPMLPSADGFEPGAGAILRAVETASGAKPFVVGKPEPSLIEIALSVLKTDRASTFVIGDQIKTDIAAGYAAGLRTIHVRTGVDEEGPFSISPDIAVETLDLLDVQMSVGHTLHDKKFLLSTSLGSVAEG